jgi:hypothetical protein
MDTQPALSSAETPSVARMFFGDAYVGTRVLKEALHRMLGLPRDASSLWALLALGMLARALGSVAAPALRRMFRPRRPSSTDMITAGAVLRTIPGIIGGDSVRGTPLAGTMMTISLVTPTLRRIPARARKVPAALVAFRRGLGF